MTTDCVVGCPVLVCRDQVSSSCVNAVARSVPVSWLSEDLLESMLLSAVNNAALAAYCPMADEEEVPDNKARIFISLGLLLSDDEDNSPGWAAGSESLGVGIIVFKPAVDVSEGWG